MEQVAISSIPTVHSHTDLSEAHQPSLEASGRLTFKMCKDGEGAEHIKSCRSLWYKMCDEYTLQAGETCNIETASDSRIEYFSSDIDVLMWDLTTDENNECNTQILLAPDIYERNRSLRTQFGICGYKFQLVNHNEFSSYDFTLLRNSAVALTSSVAAALLLTNFWLTKTDVQNN